MTDESVYDGLLGHDDVTHWAFGTGFSDPLTGVDASIPVGVYPVVLARYCLMLGDDALVLGHRLSEWCGNAHDLEDDIALANIALDLIGQARPLLARAALADPDVVPDLEPRIDGSPVPPEDALAYFRDDHAFCNVRLVEGEGGDFAVTITRLLLFATWRLALLQGLRSSRDGVLAAIAARGVHEVAYHRDYAARWFVTLARGTEESRHRTLAAVEQLWPLRWELDAPHPVVQAAAASGAGADPEVVAAEVDAVLSQVLAAADVPPPSGRRVGRVAGGTGRDGRHTEALSRMLAEMQSVARAHPRGLW